MTAPVATGTDRLTRHGPRLAQFTVAYNVAEGVVAIAAGVSAGLVSLVGCGIDSGIESVSAVLVGLRLAPRLRHGEADADTERRTLRLVALTFFGLAAYVTIEGVRDLLVGEAPDSSLVGIVLLGPALQPAQPQASMNAAVAGRAGWRGARGRTARVIATKWVLKHLLPALHPCSCRSG